jgi:DNA-binding CsgD family transcriptional regulator
MADDHELIDLIYEAAIIPENWPNILERISAIAGCYGGTLFSMDAQQEVRHIVTEQYRDVMHIFVRDGWTKQNIRAERLAKIKYPGFVTDCDVISVEEMDAHPFYTELLRPNGGGWAIGTIIPVPSGDLLVFNLERRYAKGPIEKELCGRLDPLRPHLARAGLMSSRLRMERARAMVETLKQIGLPAAALRKNGQVLAMNDLFQLLGEQITTGAFDEISIKNSASDVLMKQSLVRLAETRDNSEVKSIPIPAILDQPALIAHLIPIKGAAHDIFSRAFTILVITPLHAPTAPTEDVLNGLFDLSPAEVKVAQGIISGKTIDDVAAELKLSRETIRNQLKSVFAKTGTGRQAQLVGLLAATRFPGK